MDNDAQSFDLIERLDAIDDRVGSLGRRIRRMVGLTAVGFLGVLGGELAGAELGLTLVVAGVFALVVGVVSIPSVVRLRELKREREQLMVEAGEPHGGRLAP
jgi:hypothetical protein